MMLMKQGIQLAIEAAHISNPLVDWSQKWCITLPFNKRPTKEQMIEAVRHYLTDEDFITDIAIRLMNVVKELDVPEVDDSLHGKEGSIFCDKILFFEVVDD